jgi:putative protease
MTKTAAIAPAVGHQPSAAGLLPELLAPAGDWECARAAVENGADAIYFGLDKFNARMRANNFTEADLPPLMAFLHRRGVKGYVTFNTLIFENEIADSQDYLRAIINAGVDAAIVQDVGICRLIRELSPDFPIHASTQMTVTSAAGVEFCRELGCSLVVLARECSLKEIEKIRGGAQEDAADRGGENPRSQTAPACGDEPFPPRSMAPIPTSANTMPLEVFVHGALCVAYSGQCLTSESLGGRSANRGECAQACRMPYELIADGQPVPLGDRKYLLSPQDLAGLEILPEIVRTGVASLKIEGRLKSPEYVAGITRIYRAALDGLSTTRSAGHQLGPAGEHQRPAAVRGAANRYEMEMSFSRGLFTGWFGGTDNQNLVHARFGKKRGVFLGEVKRVLRDGVVMNLAGPLKPGDGLVFDAGHPEEKEEGGRIYEIRSPKSEARNGKTEARDVELRFGRGDIDFSRVHAGDKIWKTNDPELDRRLRQSFAGDTPRFQRPINMEVHGLAAKPLTLIVRDQLGNVVKVESAMPLARAEKQPLTDDKLREQLGRLGATPFALGTIRNLLSGEVLLPVSELNRLRREAVAELEKLRAAPKRCQLSATAADVSLRQVKDNGRVLTNTATNLIVLVRNLAQLETALKCGVTTVYCEFEDPKKYREAVAQFYAAHDCESAIGNRQSAIFVTPPRIFKPGDDWILNQVRSCNADGFLVRNYDHLKFFADTRRIGDFSLNVANHVAADYFKNHFGLERLTASYDLNVTQLDALLQSAPPDWFEITIHQHMPMFHMEHCVFCAFLSNGKDYRDCGRPCDRVDARLRDRVGAQHPLKADAGCRNTVFNSQAQTGAEFVERLLALGVRHFRVEFLNETPDEVVRTIAKYRQLLRGEISGAQLWRELKLFNQLGVTRGQMGK